MGLIRRDKKYYFMQAWMLDVGKHKLPDLADFRPMWAEAEQLGIDTYEAYLDYKKEQSKLPINTPLKRKLVTENQKTKSIYRFYFYGINQFKELQDTKSIYDGHTGFMYAMNHVEILEKDITALTEEDAYKTFRKEYPANLFEINEVKYIGKTRIDKS